jgi:hypothetical protein
LEVRVVDNPTNETAKAPAPLVKGDFKIAGRPGFGFQISGLGFGDQKGKVTIGGQTINTTQWNDTSIKGILPVDTKTGAVVTVEGVGASSKKLTGTYSSQ